MKSKLPRSKSPRFSFRSKTSFIRSVFATLRRLILSIPLHPWTKSLRLSLSWNKNLFFLILLSLLASVLFFYRLNNPHTTFTDELIIAEIADNMAITGNYLEPVYNDNVWLEKPPLYAWLTAPLISLFGNHPWVWRFWSATSAVGTTLTIYLNGLAIFSLPTALIASTLFFTNYFTLAVSQAASLDLITVFISSLAFLLLLKAEKKRKITLFIFAGTMVGLAILGRSFFGLILIPVILLSFFQSPLPGKVRAYSFLCLAMIIIALPWHLYIAVKHPRLFSDSYFLMNSLDRFRTDFVYKNEPLVPSSSQSLLVILASHSCILCLLYYIQNPARRPKEKRKDVQKLTLWLVSFGSILVISNASAPWHYLHLFVPLVLLIGAAIEMMLKSNQLLLRMFTVTLLLTNLSFGLFFFLTKTDSVQIIKTQNTIASLFPGETLYSWGKKYLHHSRFYQPQEISFVDGEKIASLLDEKKQILVFLPRHSEDELTEEIKRDCVLEEKDYRVCWLSY